MSSFIESLNVLIIHTGKALFYTPIQTVISIFAVEVGLYVIPESVFPSFKEEPVSTRSSFNKIIRSDELLLQKTGFAIGHSAKLGAIVFGTLAILTVAVSVFTPSSP